MKYFVLVFDTNSGQLKSLTSHDSAAEALRVRFDRDYEHAAETDVEVVLLRAASVESVRLTHPRYFARESEESK